MAVIARGELEESPLADLHAIASELGIEGFRRMRREELIDTILSAQGGNGARDSAPARGEETEEEPEEEGEDVAEPRLQAIERNTHSSQPDDEARARPA